MNFKEYITEAAKKNVIDASVKDKAKSMSAAAEKAMNAYLKASEKYKKTNPYSSDPKWETNYERFIKPFSDKRLETMHALSDYVESHGGYLDHDGTPMWED